MRIILSKEDKRKLKNAGLSPRMFSNESVCFLNRLLKYEVKEKEED